MLLTALAALPAVCQTSTNNYNIGAGPCVYVGNCEVLNYGNGTTMTLEYAFQQGWVIGPGGYWTQGYTQDFGDFSVWTYPPPTAPTGVTVQSWTCASAPNPTMPSQSFTQSPDPTYPGGVTITSSCLHGVLYSPNQNATEEPLVGASMTYRIVAHPYATRRGTRWAVTASSVSITQLAGI
jgi:hypothetical protein